MCQSVPTRASHDSPLDVRQTGKHQRQKLICPNTMTPRNNPPDVGRVRCALSRHRCSSAPVGRAIRMWCASPASPFMDSGPPHHDKLGCDRGTDEAVNTSWLSSRRSPVVKQTSSVPGWTAGKLRGAAQVASHDAISGGRPFSTSRTPGALPGLTDYQEQRNPLVER